MAFLQKCILFLKIPLVTFTVILFCVGFFALNFYNFINFKLDEVCLQAHGIVRLNEVSRIFSHAVFHQGPWHLAATMIPMLILGTKVERELGSILFSLVLFSFWLFSTLMEVAMATLLYHVAHELFHVCSLGMSGVVFGLMALVTKFLKSENCTLLCCRLPYKVVPWLCVILYYATFHMGSIFMHIGGLIAGYAYKNGIMDWFMPSSGTLASLEAEDWMKPLLHFPGFKTYSRPFLPTSLHNQDYLTNDKIEKREFSRPIVVWQSI